MSDESSIMPVDRPGLDPLLRRYREMVTIRLFEERVNELYRSGRMPGLAHLYTGEEAVAVGVCSGLKQDDLITSTHRGNGHCLAKGADIGRMFAELLGKEAGYCRGKGGSMHIADHANGNLGANAIVGGSTGIATGAAFSAKHRGSGQVAACFFGDARSARGCSEVMNMASLWTLPVIYVCENNLYNEYTHYLEVTAGDAGTPRAFGIEAVGVARPGCARGTEATDRLVQRARGERTGLPALQHLPLPRPPCWRYRSRLLPLGRRGAGLARAARSDHAARRLVERAGHRRRGRAAAADR
jgi:pyruvate dehydrogenase E1 component alpha subunit